MDYQKRQANTQEKANEIQGEMVGVIKKYNKMTSKHNCLMVFLTIVIIALTFATLWNTFLNQTGRYAILQAHTGGLFILDTKTSQLWARVGGKMAYMGTIKKPMYEIREIDEKKRVSEIVSELEEARKSLDSCLNELIPDELINSIEEQNE